MSSQLENLKRDVAQLKDEKSLERNKNEQLNIEIEELEAKCGLYKHNTEKLNKSFEMEVSTRLCSGLYHGVVLMCASPGDQFVPQKVHDFAVYAETDVYQNCFSFCAAHLNFSTRRDLALAS